MLATLDADLPFSVAASNSARFPYVSAPGLLRRRGTREDFGQIVDGGYYDNHGAVAAAIQRRDANAAREAMRSLLSYTSDYLEHR